MSEQDVGLVGAFLVIVEMLIADRAMSKQEPLRFAEHFKSSALAMIASSSKFNTPAREIASDFVGVICGDVVKIIAAKGEAVETVGTLN
jgi:hypothetical protein